MNQVQMAAKFYDARDALKRLLGDQYETHAQPWRELLRKVMQANRVDVMPAALMLLKDTASDGMGMMWILAATADECDQPGAKPC